MGRKLPTGLLREFTRG